MKPPALPRLLKVFVITSVLRLAVHILRKYSEGDTLPLSYRKALSNGYSAAKDALSDWMNTGRPVKAGQFQVCTTNPNRINNES